MATLLLVEDDEAVRSLVREVLEQGEHVVLEAATAESALLICQKHRETIDLLVSDVRLLGTSQHEFLPRVRALRFDILVLWMSGYSEEDLRETGKLTDGVAFLQKPFSPVELLAKVAATLSGPRPAGESGPEGSKPAVISPLRVDGLPPSLPE